MNTTDDARSLYMDDDAVLFEWDSKEQKGKGKLANKASQLI